MGFTNDKGWSARVKKAMERVKITQEVLPAANPKGTFGADSDTGRFVMRDENGVATACADFAFIGTYSTASGSWFWAGRTRRFPPTSPKRRAA